MNLIAELGEYIKTAQTDHSDQRGPWLAEMELAAVFGHQDRLPQLIVDYFTRFSTKLVTYSDIIKYIDHVTDDQKKHVYSELLSQFGDKDITSLAEICRDVNICQLNRYCGNHVNLSVEQLLTEVERLGIIYFITICIILMSHDFSDEIS